MLAFVLTVSIARSIEQSLAFLRLERRQALLTTFRGLERRWPTEGILLVSEAGKVLEMNTAAADALGVESAVLSPTPLAEIAPELWGRVCQVVQGGAAPGERVTLQTTTGRPRGLLCRVEPVTQDGRLLGSAVLLSPRSAAPVRGRSGVRPRSAVATAKYTFADFLGEAPSLREALDLARAASRLPHDKPILLGGESGTGKELLAHAIHAESRRADGPFVAVNCGALPRELVESELFGYVAGAFTGAHREGQAGRFEAADGGTIFLDEIDSVPLELQAKFLRVLEDGEVVRLGSARPVHVDVRVVAASSVDLGQRVREGRFRLDLFHRLGVVEIVLPPLRDRGDDMLRLATAFLDQECAGAGRAPLGISTAAAECLVRTTGRGTSGSCRTSARAWCSPCRRPSSSASTCRATSARRPRRGPAQRKRGASLRQVQDAIIQRTLWETGGDVAEAARRLGVAKTTIYRRLRRAVGFGAARESRREREESCRMEPG